jgi:hypothetical protein
VRRSTSRLTSSRRAASLPCAALSLCAGASLCGAFLWGCGGVEGDAVLAPRGRGELFEIAAAGPSLLIGPPASPVPDRLAVVVRPLPGGSDSAEGVEVRFRVLSGGGRLQQDRVPTGRDGTASVGYAPAAHADSTRIRASVAADPEAAVDLTVLARPAVGLAGDSGRVLAIPGASRGVLLRVPAGATVDLVPYGTSSARGRLEYAFLQGPALHADAASPAGAAVALRPSEGVSALKAAGLASAGAWGAATGASPGVRPVLAAELPPSHDIFNCRLAVHRQAPLAYVGEQLALYVDALEPPDSARLRELVRAFDREIAPRTVQLFGPPLDLDGNGKVIAVMSRSMDAHGGLYCHSVHFLGRELMYTLWEPALTAADHLTLLAHEYQHVINASQHYRWGRTAAHSDVPWLNEGFSHVAEWKAGFPGASLGRTFAFLGRMNRSLPLLGTTYDQGFLAGWFLFALYLGDRFGDGVYRELGESGLTGRANVERVTGIPFRDLLRDWFVALALSDGPPRPEPAWSYRSIRLAGEEERAAACACLPSGRLPGVAFEPLPAGLAFELVRTLDVQDADFFRFAAGDRPGVLYFHAGGDPDVELFAVRRR